MKKFSYLIRNYPLTLFCLALVWFLSLLLVVPETPLNDVAFIDKWTHLVMYGGTCSVMWFEYLRHHEELVFWKTYSSFCRVRPHSNADFHKCFESFKRFRA